MSILTRLIGQLILALPTLTIKLIRLSFFLFLLLMLFFFALLMGYLKFNNAKFKHSLQNTFLLEKTLVKQENARRTNNKKAITEKSSRKNPFLKTAKIRVKIFRQYYDALPYAVGESETFISIGKKFDMPYKFLLIVNDRVDPRSLHAGQIIYVPVLDENIRQHLQRYYRKQAEKSAKRRQIGFEELESFADRAR